jgi:hypothetical protein
MSEQDAAQHLAIDVYILLSIDHQQVDEMSSKEKRCDRKNGSKV